MPADTPAPPAAPCAPPAKAAASLTAQHRRRLREMWRSAGWPCHDLIEIDLLAAGLLERVRDAAGHETLRVTDAGVQVIAETRRGNQQARSRHEALVERIATEMGRAGRVVWRGLSLRARVATAEGGSWQVAMPDVFSIRHTTVEDYVEPIVHEIKVHRSDLLADLRREHKRAAYLALSSECWYVIREGIAQADEIPAECGVLVAGDTTLDVARPAPRRAQRLPFAVWMALARATPVEGRLDEAQLWLGDADMPLP